MKPFICMACAVMVAVFPFAQTPAVHIATDKTTSLIFPYPIKHVDRGTKELLVQPVADADNILLVKAASKDFSPTNLSVITGDGSVYSIAVCYGESATWIYRFPAEWKTSIAGYAANILDNPKAIRGIRDASWGMIARVTGIYSKDDVLYYQLELQNKSSVDYAIHFMRCYIRDKTMAKRTAVQENEITPLYVAGNSTRVKANTRNAMVIALSRFTIPGAKYLAIEIGEKNGGRNLLLKVGNRKIIRAIPLPDAK